MRGVCRRDKIPWQLGKNERDEVIDGGEHV